MGVVLFASICIICPLYKLSAICTLWGPNYGASIKYVCKIFGPLDTLPLFTQPISTFIRKFCQIINPLGRYALNGCPYYRGY